MMTQLSSPIKESPNCPTPRKESPSTLTNKSAKSIELSVESYSRNFFSNNWKNLKVNGKMQRPKRASDEEEGPLQTFEEGRSCSGVFRNYV